MCFGAHARVPHKQLTKTRTEKKPQPVNILLYNTNLIITTDLTVTLYRVFVNLTYRNDTPEKRLPLPETQIREQTYNSPQTQGADSKKMIKHKKLV